MSRICKLGLGFGLAVSMALAAPAPQQRADHAEAWFLVRLKAPLDRRAPGGQMALQTGRPALDRALADHGIVKIDEALPRSMAAKRNPERLKRFGLDRTYRFHVPVGVDVADLIERFSELPNVEYAELDQVGSGSGALVPDDTNYALQWAYQQGSDADVDGPEGWSIGVGSEELVIAVLDTGVDSDHEDLAAKLVAGYDFVNNDNDPEDDHGHGTNVASIAAAVSNNAKGVVGACWNCRIMPLKVLDSSNFGFFSWWADAMVYAADNGARVINLSAGGSSSDLTLLGAVQYAYDAGVVIVSITHNQNTSLVYYPGHYAETIAVGATNDQDLRAEPFCFGGGSGSNFGAEIDVVAPGDVMLGAALGGGYNAWCGTSQAAPLVAGLAGIMHDVLPSIGREELRHLIRAGAEDRVGGLIDDMPGFDVFYGWGRVNMDSTLQGAAAVATLHVDGASATRPYYETANPLATSYDFVRGDLSALSEDGTGVSLGDVVCLEAGSPDADTSGDEDLVAPAPGEGFFYVARFNAAPGHGSYGGSSLNRDRFPVSGECTRCGDDIREGDEVCDGSDLDGESCATQGFDAGTLACNPGCTGFDTTGCASCGNGVCEPNGGEGCISCPSDCNGDQSGNPGNQFCCGDNEGTNPVDCSDSRCNAGGFSCSQ